MSESESRRGGVTVDWKPHAFDPAASPELFDGVLARRVIAFFIDVFILAVPVVLLSMFILVFGLITFGFGWLLFWLLSPLTVIWAILYYGVTLGSRSATIGMRVMDLEMRTWYGAPVYFLLGAMHAILYWVTVSFLTPFVLLVGLLNSRHRLLHDMLLGVVVINNPVRAQALRSANSPYGNRHAV
jgi:uncharacterized RDD family membrane protein YckC